MHIFKGIHKKGSNVSLVGKLVAILVDLWNGIEISNRYYIEVQNVLFWMEVPMNANIE